MSEGYEKSRKKIKKPLDKLSKKGEIKMKVYIVEEYLNDYPENGGGYQGIAAIFTDKAKAIKFCKPPSLFEDYELKEGETYYQYVECEVE